MPAQESSGFTPAAPASFSCGAPAWGAPFAARRKAPCGANGRRRARFAEGPPSAPAKARQKARWRKKAPVLADGFRV